MLIDGEDLRSASCFVYFFVFQLVSERTLCSKGFTSYFVFYYFVYENKCNSNSYKFSYKLAFIALLPFRMNKKQQLIFYEVGGLVTKNLSVFSL